MDLGVYVMSHWVVEFVKANSRISSIRTDLVPYLINRQFQPASYLYDAIPALQHRHRPLHDLESWLVSPSRHREELMDHVMANLGWDGIRLPAPVFVGDTIYASSAILFKRDSSSRPNVGLITAKTTAHNQHGRTVVVYERTFLVYRRGEDPRDHLQF